MEGNFSLFIFMDNIDKVCLLILKYGLFCFNKFPEVDIYIYIYIYIS